MVDYKLWCFNGEPYVFLVFSNRKSGGEAEIACYDLEWKDRSDLLQKISITILEIAV